MPCILFLFCVEEWVLKFLPTKERNGLYLGGFEIQILEIWGQNLSSFVPLRNDIEILPFLSIKIVIGLYISSSLLPIPSKEGQLHCVSETILCVSFPCLLFIFLFLVHHSLHVLEVNRPLLYGSVWKLLICSNFNVWVIVGFLLN